MQKTSKKQVKSFRLRTIRTLYFFLEGILFLLLGLAILTPSLLPSWLYFLLIAAVFILLARLDYRHWRCPACGRHLGPSFLHYPALCPRCGHPIDLDERLDAAYWADQARRGYPDQHLDEIIRQHEAQEAAKKASSPAVDNDLKDENAQEDRKN